MDILTHALLQTYLTYDEVSGHFHWLADRGSAKKGDRAGTIKDDGSIGIKIDQRYYRAGRLAFFWVTGKWPSGNVWHKDLDPLNNKWANLKLDAVPAADYAETISKIQAASKKPKKKKGIASGLLEAIARLGTGSKEPEEQAWKDLCHDAPEPYEVLPAAQRAQRLWHDAQQTRKEQQLLDHVGSLSLANQRDRLTAREQERLQEHEHELDAYFAELDANEMERRGSPSRKDQMLRQALMDHEAAADALRSAQRSLAALLDLIA